MSCWFWNIDAASRGYFWTEIQAGRLRQGWGSDPKLDLRVLKKKIEAGGELDGREQAAWDHCSAMLEAIRERDLVAVKNVPEHNWFALVLVTGAYDFNLAPAPGDYGHYLPCKQVCAPFDRKSQAVPNPLARALARDQNPIRITYKHADAVERLGLIRDNAPERAKLSTIRELLGGWRRDLVCALKKRLWEQIDSRDTERLIELLLRRHFGDDVLRTAGRGESGADYVCNVPLGMDVASRVAVQVKAHRDTDCDLTGLSQIALAIKAHAAQAGLLVTLAEALGENVQTQFAEMRKTMKVDVLYGEKLYLLLLALIAEQ